MSPDGRFFVKRRFLHTLDWETVGYFNDLNQANQAAKEHSKRHRNAVVLDTTNDKLLSMFINFRPIKWTAILE